MARWHTLREILGIILLLLGFALIGSGAWMIWDWAQWAIESDKGTKVDFYYPFFLRSVSKDRWTEPFDVGLLLLIIGAAPTAIGGYLIGSRHV